MDLEISKILKPELCLLLIFLEIKRVMKIFHHSSMFKNHYILISRQMAISVQMCRIAVSQLFGGQHNPPRIAGTRITIVAAEAEDPRTATTAVVATA